MAKDYYVILGVPLDAAPDEIRSAFRKLAFRYHPDRRGAAGSGAFQTISEAYDVLSDPARRARYDRERRPRSAPRAPRPVATRAHDPEPLVSDPVAIDDRPESIRPSYEALLDRLSRNTGWSEPPKAEHDEPLNFELILTPDEAERGVRVPFQLPVFSTCYDCGGTGRHWLFSCDACRGRGRFVDRETVEVRVPARVRDGTVIEASLERLGVSGLWLRVYVRVARD